MVQFDVILVVKLDIILSIPYFLYIKPWADKIT